MRIISKLLMICVVAFSTRVFCQEVTHSSSIPNSAHTSCEHNRGSRPGWQTKSHTKKIIPDVELTTHQGEKVNFYHNLVENKVVAINFIYTTCMAVCPAQGRNFSNLQSALGHKLGKDVHLISVTFDPVVDTPKRLKEWGVRFQARPGWTFVTGPKHEIDRLLSNLTGGVPEKGQHTPGVLIINDLRDVWIYGDGNASSAQIIALIEKTKELSPNGTVKQ